MFNMTVGVYSNTLSALASSRGPWVVDIDVLSGTGILAGTLTGTTAAGLAQFYNVSFASSGTFAITASCPNMVPAVTSTLVIAPLVITTVTISSNSSSPSFGFPFALNVTMYDQLNAPWTQSATVDITSANPVIGTSSITAVGPSVIFTFTCNTLGNNAITATSSLVPASLTIDVLENCLKITKINPIVRNMQPSLNNSTFSVTIVAYDHFLTQTDFSGWVYTVDLSLSPAGNLLGVTTGSTVAGEITLNGLMIDSGGMYQITASSPLAISAVSSSINVIEIVFSYIYISSIPNPSANFQFQIEISLRNQFGDLWLQTSTVDIVGNMGLNGILSCTTSTGICFFAFTCFSSGNLQISATSTLLSAETTLEVLQDMLKFTNFLPAVRGI